MFMGTTSNTKTSEARVWRQTTRRQQQLLQLYPIVDGAIDRQAAVLTAAELARAQRPRRRRVAF